MLKYLFYTQIMNNLTEITSKNLEDVTKKHQKTSSESTNAQTKAMVARLTPRLVDCEEVAFIVSGPLLVVLVPFIVEVLRLVEVVLVSAAPATGPQG